MAAITYELVAGDTLPTIVATLVEGTQSAVLAAQATSGATAQLRYRVVVGEDREKGAVQVRSMSAIDTAAGTWGYQLVASDLPTGLRSYKLETEVRVTDGTGKILTSADPVEFDVRVPLGAE